MVLTTWGFVEKGAPRPSGVCAVAEGHTEVRCGDRRSFVAPLGALNAANGERVVRFPCRVIGRDDQGDLRCVAGKPSLDYDATEVLQSFARKCALDVVHLWEAPPVVRRYLRTGDPKLRAAARDAARAAARATAGGAAWDATWDAARAAARATAGGGAWDAARVVARDVAWAAAGAAAGDAARAAAWARQSRRLGRMLLAGGAAKRTKVKR